MRCWISGRGGLFTLVGPKIAKKCQLIFEWPLRESLMLEWCLKVRSNSYKGFTLMSSTQDYTNIFSYCLAFSILFINELHVIRIQMKLDRSLTVSLPPTEDRSKLLDGQFYLSIDKVHNCFLRIDNINQHYQYSTE